MTKNRSKAKKANSDGHTNGVKKRKYARTTPVGRVLKRFERSHQIVLFASERLAKWAARDSNPRITALFDLAKLAESNLAKVVSEVQNLFEAGWLPPKKSLAIVFEEGEDVEIADKYKEKYLKIYTKTQIMSLRVSRVLDTGEIAIRNGSSTPFLVPKSHLIRRSAEA